MSQDRVLVTGASGFVAKHCMAELLRQGYAVRGTVRSLTRRWDINAALGRAGIARPEVELVEADLTSDGGWHAAVADCRYVLHVASPFPSGEPRDPDTLIGPARDGAVRVIRAAAAAGVERFVLTSSLVAILRCNKPDALPRTEEDWADPTRPGGASYARSKTLAERAAWETIRTLEATSSMALATINPGLVLGPALDTDLSTSHNLVRLLGSGSYPALPKAALPIVDARDVARHHVLALTAPAAPGRRWICSNGTLSIRRIGELIVEALPDLRRKVPTLELPSTLIRLVAPFDRRLGAIVDELGRANLADNRRSVVELGMSYRAPEEAVRTAAASLRELGVM